MSVRALRWAQRQRIASKSLKGVLFALAARCNSSGLTTAGQAALALEAGIGVRQMKRHLAALEWLGMITRTIRSKGGRGRATDVVQLALGTDFVIEKSDLPTVATSVRKGTSATPCGRVQGDITPHLVQGDMDDPSLRSYSNRGGAELKTQQSFQGETSSDRHARPDDATAPVDGVSPPPETSPHGTTSSRRWTGSVYARHRALTARTTRGTVH